MFKNHLHLKKLNLNGKLHLKVGIMF